MSKLYDKLGVNKKASSKEIKEAFKKKAKENHPDKGGSEDEMKELNKAYSILINPEKRKHYDETGDDAPRQDFESRFLSLMNRIFLSIVEQYNEEEIKYYDLGKETVKRISNIMIELTKQEKEIIKKLEKNKEVYKRIKNKESVIALVMQNEIDMQEQQIKSIINEHEFIKQCLEKAKEFEYEKDEETEEFLMNKLIRKHRAFM